MVVTLATEVSARGQLLLPFQLAQSLPRIQPVVSSQILSMRAFKTLWFMLLVASVCCRGIFDLSRGTSSHNKLAEIPSSDMTDNNTEFILALLNVILPDSWGEIPATLQKPPSSWVFQVRSSADFLAVG